MNQSNMSSFRIRGFRNDKIKNLTDSFLKLVHVKCCVCESEDTHLIGAGKDFEYNTSLDTFLQ